MDLTLEGPAKQQCLHGAHPWVSGVIHSILKPSEPDFSSLPILEGINRTNLVNSGTFHSRGTYAKGLISPKRKEQL